MASLNVQADEKPLAQGIDKLLRLLADVHQQT